MNKLSIRIVIVTLVSCILCTSLTGCELSKKLINDSANSKKLKQAKLVFYFPKINDADLMKKQAIKTVIKKLEDEVHDELNVKLDFRWSGKGVGWFVDDYGNSNPGGIYSGHIDEVLSKIKSGEIIDAFFVRNDYGLKKLVDEGVVNDLSNLIQDYGDKLSRNYTSSDLAAYTYDGKLAMLPNLMPVSQRLYAIVRKDLLKKYSINKIETLEDLDKFLEAVKANEKSYTPLYSFWFFHGAPAQINLTEFFTEYMGYIGRIPYYYDFPKASEELGIGYRWDDPNTKLIPFEQTREFKETFNLIKRWYDKEYVYSKLKFLKGTYAASIATMDEMLAYMDEINSCITGVGTQEELEFFPLYPKLPVRKSYFHEAGIAIGKNSRHPERAMMFLNWIHESQENYDLFMYGKEGVNYKKVGKKIRVVTEQDYNKYKDRYFPWPGYSAFINKDYNCPFEGNNFDLSSLHKKSLKQLVRNPPVSGFRSDMVALQGMTKARREITKKYSDALDLPVMYDIYDTEIKYSDNFLNDYINDQKSAGVDVLVKTLQNQLDKWKKNQEKK